MILTIRKSCVLFLGGDSDVMLDIVWRCDKDNKVAYVWFDTGLEYDATKRHLKYLKNKYDIEIECHRPKKPIPLSCKEYGQPFISKYVSEMISRLQRHDFRWEDESFECLYEKYPNCKIALNWWCNNSGDGSRFNISRNKYLKEFMLNNPPAFKISNKCCLYAKKNIIHELILERHYDLNIFGVRKAEGGARSSAYKNCFDQDGDGYDNYRPLFWYSNSDKQMYENAYTITHSDCYTVYGLPRTGCSGCPFGRDFENELDVIKTHEPRLYKAVNNIFADSYSYTRRYYEFRKLMDENRE